MHLPASYLILTCHLIKIHLLPSISCLVWLSDHISLMLVLLLTTFQEKLMSMMYCFFSPPSCCCQFQIQSGNLWRRSIFNMKRFSSVQPLCPRLSTLLHIDLVFFFNFFLETSWRQDFFMISGNVHSTNTRGSTMYRQLLKILSFHFYFTTQLFRYIQNTYYCLVLALHSIQQKINHRAVVINWWPASWIWPTELSNLAPRLDSKTVWKSKDKWCGVCC